MSNSKIRAADDILAYVSAYWPSLPEEDQTSVDEQLLRVADLLREILSRSRSPVRRKWLELAQLELTAAIESNSGKEADAADRQIQDCREYLRRALQGRQLKTSFEVGPDGGVSRVE